MKLFFLSTLLASAAAIVLPTPAGPYSVSMEVHSLTDTSRMDPFAPADRTHHRHLMISMFLPIEKNTGHCSVSKTPYMTPETASAYGSLAASVGLSNDTFKAFELEFCAQPCQGGKRNSNVAESFPLAIFSPGYGESRLLYGAMARSLASRGYVVATIDHPYDAKVVEFPNGNIIRAANLSEDDRTLEKVVKVRATDISFLLDQLHDKSTLASLTNGFPGNIELDKVIVYGHSLGGSAAAELMRSDERFRGGIDIDGRLVNPAKDGGIHKPFLLAGRPEHRLEDPTWDEFWPNIHCAKAQLAVSGTKHGSFTDLPRLFGALGLPEEAKEAIQAQLGSIEADKLDTVRDGMLVAFFDLALRSRPSSLRQIEQTFSEVSIVDINLSIHSCKRTKNSQCGLGE